MNPPVSSATRHMFAIKVLDRLPGLFKPHRYLYHCARCKWSFVVNDGRRGMITPVDGDGKPLAHDEAVKRAATFALGPCPALEVLNGLAAIPTSKGPKPPESIALATSNRARTSHFAIGSE